MKTELEILVEIRRKLGGNWSQSCCGPPGIIIASIENQVI